MHRDPSQSRYRLEHEKIIRSALRPDEEISWWGRPRQGFLFRPVDAILIPFIIVWSSTFYSVNSGNPGMWDGILDKLFIAVSLGAAAYVAVGRYFVDIRVRANTFYALTDNDAVIISGFFSRSTRRIGLKSMRDVSVKDKPDGSGSVILGPTSFFQIFEVPGLPKMSRQYESSPAFDMIPEARKVYEMIQERRAA